MASGPSLGEWVTLYFSNLSGKGDENGRGLQPLETNQGPGILRICLASQMERLQHRRKMVSTEIYKCQLMSPGPGMAEHRTCHPWAGGEKEKRQEGISGPYTSGSSPGGKTRPAQHGSTSPQASRTLCALRKRESAGLAGSPLVSRKGQEYPTLQLAPCDLQGFLN